MDNAARLAVFQAQVDNVRSLDAATRQIRRTVNEGLRRGNKPLVTVHTKVLAQVFCAWAEANFLKVIHTPHGFTLAEMSHIRRRWKENGITGGWETCIQLGLRKVPAKKGNFVPNARQRLNEAVQRFVTDPSLLRNKIAHGQWVSALNRGNASINAALSTQLAALTIVDIDRWYGCHRRLANIMESLIESPERTFLRDYWPQLVELEEFIAVSAGWTLAVKVTGLQTKMAAREGS